MQTAEDRNPGVRAVQVEKESDMSEQLNNKREWVRMASGPSITNR